MTRNAIGAVAVSLLVAAVGLAGVGAAAAVPVNDAHAASDAQPVPLAQATDGNESDNGTPSVSFQDQSSNGSAVVVNQTTLPEGGFVVAYSQGGTVLGNSSYLEPGQSQNVTVELNATLNASQVVVAVPHMDTNDNQTFDFNTSAAEEAAGGEQTVQEEDIESADITDGPYTDEGLPVSSVAFVTVDEGEGNESVAVGPLGE